MQGAAAEIAVNKYTDSVMRAWCSRALSVHVRLSSEKLAEVAEATAAKEMKVPDWKIPGVYPDDHRAFVIHNFWLNTVNFAFTHFGGKYNKYQLPGNPMFVGAFACAAAFMRGFERSRRILSTYVLTAAVSEGVGAIAAMAEATDSLKKTKRFFRGENGIPMAGERRANLRSAIDPLVEKYAGDPWNILEEADWHAFEHGGKPGIVDLLVRDFGPAFDDRETVPVTWAGEKIGEHTLLFMKRAQLFPLMLHGRALASDGALPLIRDAHRIGPVADYSVPNALRHLGILEYASALAQSIDGEKRLEIAPHSKAEIEIRMATVAAMVELLREVNTRREKAGSGLITMVELDYAVWSLGRKAKYLHHLTRTTAY